MMEPKPPPACMPRISWLRSAAASSAAKLHSEVHSKKILFIYSSIPQRLEAQYNLRAVLISLLRARYAGKVREHAAVESFSAPGVFCQAIARGIATPGHRQEPWIDGLFL